MKNFIYKAKRLLCAICALTIFGLTAAFPSAMAAGESSPAFVADDTLTAADARQMQQADSAVAALTDSPEYSSMTESERRAAALEQLEELASQGLIRGSSIYVDEENGILTFAYACGALGGVTYAAHEDAEESFALPVGGGAEENGLLESSGQRFEFLGDAMIYYAYDNVVSSNRYPYYAYMQAFWATLGLTTRMDTDVTVADMRGMNRYDLCIISAHGTYYTYTSGLIFKKTRTEPVILLLEESTFLKDLLYGFDLLSQRVIKVDGRYCLTPDFFSSAYSDGSLSETIILSETCDFYGANGIENSSMGNALLAGGAKAVLGYPNKVYTVYSRLVVWDVVNHLIIGWNIQEAADHAMKVYGADDIIWYNANGGKHAHTWASYPIIYGSTTANLPKAAGIAAEAKAKAAAAGDDVIAA